MPAFVFIIVLWLLTLTFLISTLSLSAAARSFPQLILLPTFILLSWIGIIDICRQLTDRSEKVLAQAPPGNHRWVKWLLLPPTAIAMFGFLSGILIFLFLYLRWFSKETWPVVLLSTGTAFIGFIALGQIAPVLLTHQGVLGALLLNWY